MSVSYSTCKLCNWGGHATLARMHTCRKPLVNSPLGAWHLGAMHGKPIEMVWPLP